MIPVNDFQDYTAFTISFCESLQLVLVSFEDEGLKRIENKSIRWFTKRFGPKCIPADNLPGPAAEVVI